MLNVEEVRDHWETIRCKLKEKWDQLTDEDLQMINDNIDQVITRIQERIGAERRTVEEFLQYAADAAPTTGQLKEAAQHAAEQAAQRVRQGYDQVSQRVQEGYQTAERSIRTRPLESIATTFMFGLLTGVVLGMVMRRGDD